MIRVIADSSHDMNEELKKTLVVELIPFKLVLDDKEYVDDQNLDIDNFRKEMLAAGKAGSACPSPNDFLENFKKIGDVFAVTISDKLSGTYNSACLAKTMYEEEYKNGKKIHIFDSKSAAGAETLVSLKIKELVDMSFTFDEIVEKVEDYIANMKTYFISESLDNLMKNGRISRFKGTLATLMHIKPIMGALDGEIVLIEKARGSNKAFNRMVEIVLEKGEDFSGKVLAIAHANNEERAKSLMKIFQEKANFKDIVIVPTAGLSTLYVDNKGIIISY
ncbi:MAG: DegV family protein [Clostridiales bacterium]|nr:DegV family protein [Clostridiales bacterium]